MVSSKNYPVKSHTNLRIKQPVEYKGRPATVFWIENGFVHIKFEDDGSELAMPFAVAEAALGPQQGSLF